jgi:transposase-like protein
VPEKITIDKSGANAVAIERSNAEQGRAVEVRQITYLNNLAEQDHRAIKRVTRPMLGFKSFRAA